MKLILPLILLALVGAGLWWINSEQTEPVNNEINNNTLVNNAVVQDDTCVGMSWLKAKQIANTTEWAGWLTDDRFCNKVTKTWWINLSYKQPNCLPALVVHTDTGVAEINWRCMGALPVNQ